MCYSGVDEVFFFCLFFGYCFVSLFLSSVPGAVWFYDLDAFKREREFGWLFHQYVFFFSFRFVS